MAIIKKSEFKQMNETQLTNKLAELQKEMMKLRSQVATHTTLENPGRVYTVRKTIARIHTRLNEKKKAPEAKEQKQKTEKKEEKSQSSKTTKKEVVKKNQ